MKHFRQTYISFTIVLQQLMQYEMNITNNMKYNNINNN